MLNIFVETAIHFFQDSLMKNSSKQPHLFEIEVFCNIIHFLTVTFDQFNAILLNNSINFLKGLAEPKLLNETKMNYSV